MRLSLNPACTVALKETQEPPLTAVGSVVRTWTETSSVRDRERGCGGKRLLRECSLEPSLAGTKSEPQTEQAFLSH